MKKVYLFAAALFLTGVVICGGARIANAAMNATAESKESMVAEPTPCPARISTEEGSETDADEVLKPEDSNSEMDYYLHTEKDM